MDMDLPSNAASNAGCTGGLTSGDALTTAQYKHAKKQYHTGQQYTILQVLGNASTLFVNQQQLAKLFKSQIRLGQAA